ncbi:MAG: LacI family DNA-binding transcriptional regulator [Bryobacteraceae bacterium]
MPVQMKDVAEKAGVSVTTVSHVLNKTRHVAPQTRDRVLRAMKDLSYYKNVSARLLARGMGDSFGLIISDIENPFFPELIRSFEIAALNQGFDVILGTTNYDPGQSRRAVGRMIENKVRGVAVMTTQLDASFLDDLVANGIAVAVLDSGPVRRSRSNIRVDYSSGAQALIGHLKGLGHRELTILSGPRSRTSAVHYRQALEEAIASAGLPPARTLEGDNRVEGGAAAVRFLLSQPAFPSALICGNDSAAIGAMQAVAEAGLRIPQDVSIAGSDDIPFARYSSPPMTTVRIPRDQLGRMAFDALQKMLRTKRRTAAELVLETTLVVRQSTGPARAGG